MTSIPSREPVTWFSVNLRSGGMSMLPHGDSLVRWHGTLSMRWLDGFADVVGLSPARPDIVFLQEAKWFNHYGDELLHYVERLLWNAGLGAYRGFLTLLRRSHHHQVILINTGRMQAVHHWHGGHADEHSGAYGFVEVIVDGDTQRPLWLKSVHLDPADGDERLAEVKDVHLAATAQPHQRVILAGDFNSITSRRSPAEGEPQRRFAAMPAARRFDKGLYPPSRPDGDTDPDTRAIDYLIDTGWTDAHIALGNSTPTIAPGVDAGGEVIIDRCLTYGGLSHVSMWVDRSSVPYSDHRALGGVIAISDERTA